MTTSLGHWRVGSDGARSRGRRTGLVWRLVPAAGLLVSAAVHADLASSPFYAAGQLTLSALFLAQAVAAVLAAAWLLAGGRRAALAVAAVVALGSLLAVVLSTYLRLPSFGPFPVLYEPFWYTEKVVAAVAAALAAGAALVGLASSRGDTGTVTP